MILKHRFHCLPQFLLLDKFLKDFYLNTFQEIVDFLNVNGIRTHVRKADHYSGNILNPLGWEDCVRVSVCHYNSSEEIKSLLLALNEFQMKLPTN